MADLIKILCVEDSVNVQQMLSFILKKAGYEPHIANNGREAISQTQRSRNHAKWVEVEGSPRSKSGCDGPQL